MLQLTRSCNIWIFFLENLKGYKVYIEVENRFCFQKTGDHATGKTQIVWKYRLNMMAPCSVCVAPIFWIKFT